MVFIAEVTGDNGWPFEDVAIAAIDAEDVDEARDFLVAALMAKNRHLFEAGARRWDETSAIVTREASPAEATAWRERRATNRDAESAVVWLVDI
jgi:hypothetical protein